MRFYKKVSNLFKKIFFSDVTPLIRLGATRPLLAEDMPPVVAHLKTDQTELALNTIQDHRPYYFVFKSFWNTGPSAKWMFLIGVLRLPVAAAAPLLLRQLLNSFDRLAGLDLTMCFGLAFLLGMTSILDGILVQHYYLMGLTIFARITSGLNMRVFRKALELSRQTQLKTQTGDLVNHLGSDTEGVAESSFFVPEMVFGILQILISFVLLIFLLGPAGWIACIAALVVSPVFRWFAKRYEASDAELWKHRDYRVTLMSQILGGIRLIKSFAWEKSIVKEVDRIRGLELGAGLALVKNESMSIFISLGSSLGVSLIAFSSYVSHGGHLSSAILFPCIMIFHRLDDPLSHIPHWVKNLIHSRVAAKRLRAFFELKSTMIEHDVQATGHDPWGVKVQGLSVELEGNSLVRDVTFEVKSGKSLAIVGEVGCGKTSLLYTLLGELPFTAGALHFVNDQGDSVKKPRAVGWVPQEAFVLNATVEDNILLGQSYPDLKSVLEDCALTEDLQQWSAGIHTEIGEKGVTLSGGQKQRIALARVASQDLGLILLDDPLSSVDVRTEKHLVEKLLFGRWANRTRIMATHRLDFLNRFDEVLFLRKDHQHERGRFEELLSRSEVFRSFYSHHEEVIAAKTAQGPLGINSSQSNSETTKNQVKPHSGQLVGDEDRNVGAIESRLFFEYFLSLGGEARASQIGVLSGLLGLTFLSVGLPILQGRWLGYWGDQQNNPLSTMNRISPAMAIGIFSLFGVAILFVTYFERLGWVGRSIEASRRLHFKTLTAVMSAPVRFFDANPMGRVLNRFSRDLAGIDDELSWSFRGAVSTFAAMCGTLILIFSVVPLLALVFTPVLFFYYGLQRDYRKSAREAKRLESIARSPRYAHFKETLGGLGVVRALGKEKIFLDRFVSYMEGYTRQYWASILINRWFSSRAPIVSGVIAMATGFSVVFLVSHGKILPGLAGLVLTYASTFWGQLNWCVRAFSEAESRMTSYERLKSYSQIKAEEDRAAGKSIRPTWPERGEIVFENVSARYSSELPDVLKNIDLKIAPNSKVGVIGRTGSGKSSLVQALYRFLEIHEGRILIDGISIHDIPKERLRQAFAIIPQDPILFLGSIRSNLDRFELFSDEKIWDALEKVQMKQVIEKQGGLQAIVSEGGNNFSQGQRQLLCLARALLVESKMVILDEATASIDVSTDVVIQKTIQKEFKHATVLIIAHRLGSVSHCPWILRLKGGVATMAFREKVISSESAESETSH